MFVYLTRKVQMIFEMGYAREAEMQEIAESEINQWETPKPNIVFSSNPFRCLRDLAQDVEYNEKDNQIVICKRLIKSKEGLKGSILREKSWKHSRKLNSTSNDDQQAQAIIQACNSELSLYKYIDSATREEAVKLCSKIQAKLKISNTKKRNIDTWHFYTRKLIEDNWYTYQPDNEE